LVQEDRKGNNYVYVLQLPDEQDNIYQVKKGIVQLGKSYRNEVVIGSGLKQAILSGFPGFLHGGTLREGVIKGKKVGGQLN